ncbi:helix-hairpin-helix domain-containing protein [Kallotenue papyrolyticum]|uniref:helix-hairpin-helix domain-containing protein n=1 Tax=Kallotenue papyrolyticum TaxID=1325125 RepID=UPI00047856C1|nr:helix-hairpin-helix domain-containing protein [Kallotenue papyrolyticum]
MTVLNSVRIRWALTALVLALMVLVVLRSLPRQRDDATRLIIATPQAAVVDTASQPAASPAPMATLVVDVIGAVQRPGVYALTPGARVVDAVNAAGGLAPDADRERINLAQPVADGEQIRVPRIGDALQAAEAPAGSSSGTAAGLGLIDLNRADAATLERLPGIGPATAQAIIAYRAEHGRFASIEELDNVSGIGPSTIERVRPYLTVGP